MRYVSQRSIFAFVLLETSFCIRLTPKLTQARIQYSGVPSVLGISVKRLCGTCLGNRKKHLQRGGTTNFPPQPPAPSPQPQDLESIDCGAPHVFPPCVRLKNVGCPICHEGLELVH